MAVRLELGPVVNYGKEILKKTGGIRALNKVIDARGPADGFGNGLIAMGLSYIFPAMIRGMTSEPHSEFKATAKGVDAVRGGLDIIKNFRSPSTVTLAV